MNVMLCGMPCCGKSYYGERLAKLLNRPFLDTDRYLEQQWGQSCRTFVLTQGEAAFREKEKAVLDHIQSYTGAIIAPGGGVVYHPEFMQACYVIYLKTDPALLYDRITKKKELPSYIDPTRPEASFQELLQKRIALYAQVADATIETDRLSEAEILWQATTLVKSFESRHGANPTEKPSALSSMAARQD